MRATSIFYTCKKCHVEFEVSVTPDVPGNISGPPENCYPDEPGEIEPDKCECGEKIDEGECQEKAFAKHRDDVDYDTDRKGD